MSISIGTPSTGSCGSNDMNSRYALTKHQVNDFVTETNTPTFIQNIAKIFSNPFDNVISLQCFPFDVKAQLAAWGTADGPIICNVVTMTTTGAFLNPLAMPIMYLGSTTVTGNYGNFLDYSPYTKLYLYLPYVGFVELDPDEVMGKQIDIHYAIDLITGKCTAFVETAGSGTPILMRDGQIGNQIQIAGGTGSMISRSMLQMGIGAVSSGVSLASGAVSAGMSKQGGTGQSIASTAGASANWLGSTTVNAINAGQVKVDKSGTNSGNNSLYGPQNPYLIYVYPEVERASNYAATKGIPSGKSAKLKNLSGYNAIEAVHIEGISGITSDEASRLDSILKNGVIL